MTTPPTSPLPPQTGEEHLRPRHRLLFGVLALVAVAGAAWWLLRSEAPEAEIAANSDVDPTSDEPGAESSPAEATPRKGTDTTKDLLDAAKRALAWHTEAVLAEIRATFVDGGIDGPQREGLLEVHYGQPRDGFGPGAPLVPQRLVVTYPKDSPPEQKIVRVPGNRIGLPEPNCPIEVAWLKATQAGVPREQPIELHYVLQDRLRRAVWRASGGSPKVTRLIDGNSCSVLAP